MSVDLPVPVGPTTNTNSPGAMARDTSRTATTPFGYVLETRSNSIAAGPGAGTGSSTSAGSGSTAMPPRAPAPSTRVRAAASPSSGTTPGAPDGTVAGAVTSRERSGSTTEA